MMDQISAYGAFTGPVSLLISIYLVYLRRKEKTPQLITKIKDDPYDSEKMIISVINRGLIQVSLAECRLLVQNQGELEVQLVEDYKQFNTKGFISRSNLLSGPYELYPGKRYDIAIFKNDLYLALIKKNILHGKVRLLSNFKDEIENIYKSNIYKFYINNCEENQ
jgi:hypothetical protein